jgi:hypothetical protein
MSPVKESTNRRALARDVLERDAAAPGPPVLGQAETGQRRIEHLDSAVEDELAFNAHPSVRGRLFRTPKRTTRHTSAGAD